jgi:hypothetical protein
MTITFPRDQRTMSAKQIPRGKARQRYRSALAPRQARRSGDIEVEHSTSNAGQSDFENFTGVSLRGSTFDAH